MAVQALFSGPAGWLTIGMVGLIFVWGGGAIWMLSYARGTFKYNSDLFLRLLLRADKVDKKDEDVIKFMKLIQGHDYGGALNWVVDKKKTKTDTYSHALALEETLTPLGLAGTVLGVFLAFSGPSSAADISKLYPNLGLAIVTTLAGIVMFVVVKIFFESGTTQAYNEMMEAADNLAAAINSNAEWLKDL